MTTTLKLYKNNPAFPAKPHGFPGDGEKQACIADYKYSASRMSSAPNITATLKWPWCLDKEWSTSVFVSYNGERFFVKNTPSSSYDNTSKMYSHSLELVSERAILDSVYFVDIPTKQSGDGENPQGDSLSDNSEFSFSGDIYEFVSRLNKSLEKSGVGGATGYKAMVDGNIECETKLFEVSNQYVTDALKSAYELYEIPYYFDGKDIHFGNQQTNITTPLEYGADKSLLSVSKSNANKQVITKITGTGSERNIPYYYPNPTAKGRLKLGGGANEKYEIFDQLAFANELGLDKPFYYKKSNGTCSSTTVGPTVDNTYGDVEVEVDELSCSFNAVDAVYKVEFSGGSVSGWYPNFVPVLLKVKSSGTTKTMNWSDWFLSGKIISKADGTEYELTPSAKDNSLCLGYSEKLTSTNARLYTFVVYFRAPISRGTVIISSYGSNTAGDEFRFSSFTAAKSDSSLVVSTLTVSASDNKKGRIYAMPVIKFGGTIVENPLSLFKSGEVFDGEKRVSTAYISNGAIYFGNLAAKEYTVKNVFLMPVNAGFADITVSYEIIDNYYWELGSNGDKVDLDEAGVRLKSGESYSIGDTLIQEIEYRIDVKNTLMPSEYRRKLGKNRWYTATNNGSRGEWYGDIVFDTEYDSSHPSEYVYSDEEIYPTIKEMTNAAGQRIDSFLEIAFDRDDNDEVYAEGEEKAGEYIHPYFFVKLKKTDGPNGFNLFDHAIEGEEMKVSFTTGHVAGCEFVIGIDENTVEVKNPVLVDSDGSLLRNDKGDVLCGRWGQELFGFQDEQQNTQTNEVWIALKKEDSTMGVLMPDWKSNLIPKGDLNEAGDIREEGGDLFVLLGILLPEAYIKAAEDRLEQKTLEYLKDNNSEKFSFSLKLSSIFLADNTRIAEELNENSKVILVYDGEIYSMYVSSYSLTAKESSALPEVTINIDNEIKVAKKKTKDALKLILATDAKIKQATSALTAKIQSTSNQTKDISNKLISIEENIGNIQIQALAVTVDSNSEQLKLIANNNSKLANRLSIAEQKLIEHDTNFKTITTSYLAISGRVSTVESKARVVVVNPTNIN